MEDKLTEGIILVVDDDSLSRTLHRKILAKHYDVMTASSGREALNLFDSLNPDLVLMDAEMPDVNGYEASTEIRKKSEVPIIFVTGNTSLEEHLRAYESGGNDLIIKPINAEVLSKKAAIAIERYQRERRKEQETQALQSMAMNFLSQAGQSGTLMNFMRTAVAAPTHDQLALNLLEATQSLGLQCVVRIEHDHEFSTHAYHGTPTPLELSILAHASGMGRVFQFKNRLVVNYDRVTIVVSNTNADSDSTEAGVARDNIAILAEAAQAFAENIDLKRSAAQQAEQMQLALSTAEHALSDLSHGQQSAMADVQILLHELVDGVERSYTWLNTTQAQEAEISRRMTDSVNKVLDRLAHADNFEQPLQVVIQALRMGYARRDAIELF